STREGTAILSQSGRKSAAKTSASRKATSNNCPATPCLGGTDIFAMEPSLAAGVEMVDVDRGDVRLVLRVMPEHGHDRGRVVQEQERRCDPTDRFNARRHVRPHGKDDEKDREPKNDDERNCCSRVTLEHSIDPRAQMLGHVRPYRDFSHSSTSNVGSTAACQGRHLFQCCLGSPPHESSAP